MPATAAPRRTALPVQNLDVLRAIAVACVLVDHLFGSRANPVPGWADALGRSGVLLFFVHTSLVLMASLERSGESAVPFLVRRAWRLYPLAIVTVLAVVTLRLQPGVQPPRGGWTISASELVANLTLTQTLFGMNGFPAPLWSLSVELEMYL